jgi:hypothetical protein
MKKSYKQLAIITGFLFLGVAPCFSQDTTVVTEYKILPGAKYQVMESKPDTVIKTVTRTITKWRTVYVDSSKLVVADPGTFTDAYFSKQVSKDFLLFANYCSRNKKTCVVDLPLTITSTIALPPGHYKFTDSVFNYAYPAFTYPVNGKYTFEGLRLRQFGHSMFVYNNRGMTDTTLFLNCRIDSGENAYYTTAGGGRWDELTDSVLVWAGVTLQNCRFATYLTSVVVYNQPGPSRYIHIDSVSVWNTMTHGFYTHSNISIRIRNLVVEKIGVTLVSGNPGDAWRSSTGGKGIARYVDIEGVSGVGAWQLYKPRGDGYIRNCRSFKAYAAPVQPFIYENIDTLSGFVKGTVINCNGGQVFATDNTSIIGGDFNEINLSQGGTVSIKNSFAKAMFGSNDATGKPVYLTLSNTVIKSFRVFNGGSLVTLSDGAKIESYSYNWKPPAGMIVLQ